MENRSNTSSSDQHRKLFWGSITLEEIKHAISVKKSTPEYVGQRSSVRNEYESRSISSGSLILNSLIRQHFFGNRLEDKSETLSNLFKEHSFVNCFGGSEKEDNILKLSLRSSHVDATKSCSSTSNSLVGFGMDQANPELCQSLIRDRALGTCLVKSKEDETCSEFSKLYAEDTSCSSFGLMLNEQDERQCLASFQLPEKDATESCSLVGFGMDQANPELCQSLIRYASLGSCLNKSNEYETSIIKDCSKPEKLKHCLEITQSYAEDRKSDDSTSDTGNEVIEGNCPSLCNLLGKLKVGENESFLIIEDCPSLNQSNNVNIFLEPLQDCTESNKSCNSTSDSSVASVVNELTERESPTSFLLKEKLKSGQTEQNAAIETENNLFNLMETHTFNENQNESLLIKDVENTRSSPEINLNINNINNSPTRLDESINTGEAENSTFNNTLEEIDFFLKSRNSLTPNASPNTRKPTFDPRSEPCKKFLSRKLHVLSLNKVSKKLFKAPTKPKPKLKTLNMGSIISPVAMYIKNPSTIPPVQHVRESKIKKSLFKQTDQKVKRSENKENFNVILPLRLYKPAKNTILLQKSSLKLPSNIERQMPLTSQSIKHSTRIGQRDLSDSILEERLGQEDLTACFSDTMNLSADEVSVLIAKDIYIE